MKYLVRARGRCGANGGTPRPLPNRICWPSLPADPKPSPKPARTRTEAYEKAPGFGNVAALRKPGFAGVGLGIQLKKAGIETFSILEKSDGVGGTWRDNIYPGAACDSPRREIPVVILKPTR